MVQTLRSSFVPMELTNLSLIHLFPFTCCRWHTCAPARWGQSEQSQTKPTHHIHNFTGPLSQASASGAFDFGKLIPWVPGARLAFVRRVPYPNLSHLCNFVPAKRQRGWILLQRKC